MKWQQYQRWRPGNLRLRSFHGSARRGTRPRDSGRRGFAGHGKAAAHCKRIARDHGEPDAGDVSRRARPDHRRHRAADHRPPVSRRQQSVVGDHRLSRIVDRDGAGVRDLERHLRASRDDSVVAAFVHCGLGAVRARTELDRAHSRSCSAGRRRRGHSSGRADHYRRRDHAARARPVPGLLQRGLGCGRHRRSGPRRRDDRVSRLVGDLLDQPATWRCGDGRAAAKDETHPAAPSASRTRLDGRPAVDVGGDRCAPGADVGRHPLRLALARDSLDDCRGPPAHRHLPVACPPHR